MGPRIRKIVFMVDDAELAELDEFQFSRRIRTRAEAIRLLMRRGYEAVEGEGHKDEGRED